MNILVPSKSSRNPEPRCFDKPPERFRQSIENLSDRSVIHDYWRLCGDPAATDQSIIITPEYTERVNGLPISQLFWFLRWFALSCCLDRKELEDFALLGKGNRHKDPFIVTFPVVTEWLTRRIRTGIVSRGCKSTRVQ